MCEQRLFRAFHNLILEGITNIEALQDAKFFLAGFAYQLLSNNMSIYYSHKRFYKAGQLARRPIEEMKKLNGKSIIECIPAAVFCFLLTFIDNCLKVLPQGKYEWDAEHTKYTQRSNKGCCGGYSQAGITLYWQLLDRELENRKILKSLPKDQTRADFFWYDAEIADAECTFISKTNSCRLAMVESTQPVNLLFEESSGEESSTDS